MASVDSAVWDKRCSDVLFAEISKDIVNWEELAPYFGLTEAEEKEIKVNHAHQYKVQKHKCCGSGPATASRYLVNWLAR